MTEPVKIGILGAGTVATYALIAPAQQDGALDIVAVGARDAARAQAYADEHGIPRGMSYQAILDEPAIEAVYIAVPNSLHREWALKALDAGKAVLCEKPLASNAAETQSMADYVAAKGGILVDAMHSRYHPAADRMREIVLGGLLGEVREVQFSFLVPKNLFQINDIRFQYALAGGCVMDVGYYGLSFLRHTLGAEPEAVLSATATLIAPMVDGTMKTSLRYPGGITAHMDLSLVEEGEDLVIEAQVTGSRGRMVAHNPVHPTWGKTIELTIDGKSTVEENDPTGTYIWQARAFRDNVRKGTPVLTPASDSVAIMTAVDAIYRAAGLPVRGEGA